MKQLTDIPGYGILLTPLDVAKITGKTQASLTCDRFEGKGLPFVKIGRLVRYRKQDVLDFINGHTFSSTTQAKQSV